MIYFIRRERDNAIKIGCTSKLDRRITALKSQHGEITLLGWCPGDYGTEQDLHLRFSHLNIEGEFFSPGSGLLHYINTMTCSKNPRKLEQALFALAHSDWCMFLENEKLRERITELERERDLLKALRR